MTNQVQESPKEKQKLGWFSTLAVGGVLAFYVFVGAIVFIGWQDQSLKALWDGLEGPGRATILSSLITALGLLTSAIVLPFIFKDRVSSLDDMVRKTEQNLGKLSVETKENLDRLTESFQHELEQLRNNSDRQARHTDSLLDGVYKLLSIELGGGEVSDAEHANKIVAELWERAKIVCGDRLESIPRIREVTKESIRELRKMSDEYLDRLAGIEAINESERDMLLRLKKIRLQQSAITPDQFPDVKELRKLVSIFSGDEDTQ